MSKLEAMSDLIREILNDPPCNKCADNGVHCIFCYSEWDQGRAWKNDKGIEHSSDCWLNRATEVLDGIQ